MTSVDVFALSVVAYSEIECKYTRFNITPGLVIYDIPTFTK